jgi:hypothetical protein
LATSSNLTLWQSVCETDPKYTKSFTKGGGFSGTAINATYLIRKATEAFGPMGGNWGVDVADEQYVPGAPIFDGQGTPCGNEIIHVVRIELWYRLQGDDYGRVTAFGQTTFVGRNKHGFFTDEEAPKKSLTDATTKALSLLGFASDVHLGLFDDNKYVNDLKKKVEEEARTPEITAEQITAAHERLNACQTLDELSKTFLSMTPVEKKACEQLKNVLKATLSNKPKSGSASAKASSPPRRSAKPSASPQAPVSNSSAA